MLRVIACPACTKLIETDERAGITIDCPYCDRPFRCPRESVNPAVARRTARSGSTLPKWLIPLGYVLFVGLPMVGVVAFGAWYLNRKPEPEVAADTRGTTDAPAERRDRPRPEPERKSPPRRPVPRPELATAPEPPVEKPKAEPKGEVAIEPETAPEPRAVEPTEATEGGVAEAEAVVLEIAPAPRRANAFRPPEGFVSAWKERGIIRTRVVGVRLGPVPFVDKTDTEVVPTKPLLAVWVETENVSPTPMDKDRPELRRWMNPLDSYAELEADGEAVRPAKFGPGLVRVTGQLEGGHLLTPKAGGVVDVLVFEAPPAYTKELELRLAGGHVKAAGDFYHIIPAAAWKQTPGR